MDRKEADRVAVVMVLKSINRAWQEGRLDALTGHLHEDVVMVPPGFQGSVRGAEACRQSFEAFLAAAKTEKFEESDFQIDILGDTAVTSYRFDMTYSVGEQSFNEAGREIWVLVRLEGRWRAAWRTQ
ncbi:MAG: nuclear transport factor 2 family protein, partial [Candidatus Eremiobacterota bacterium]